MITTSLIMGISILINQDLPTKEMKSKTRKKKRKTVCIIGRSMSDLQKYTTTANIVMRSQTTTMTAQINGI